MDQTKTNWTYLFLLILSGEAIFVLPFVLQRVFRSTVLEVFQISNTELGLCFTYYGITAMVSYFLGGPIADRFEPRKLIASSLWATAFGGVVYALFPGLFALQLLYAYWGFTTILLFWSPMIKATRIWGGANDQAMAFGFLDGGRGLVATLFGVLAITIFSSSLSEGVEAQFEDRRQAFKWAIYGATALIMVVGVLAWKMLKLNVSEEKSSIQRIQLVQLVQVLKLPSVWLLMSIILCAYTGYKITDVVSLYAREVLDYNEIESAQIGTFFLFMRPIVSISIGLLADRFKPTLTLIFCFSIMLLGSLWFASAWGMIHLSMFVLSIFILATGIYAVRALYFAIMEQGKIPLHLTGTAVGIVSVIGFTPDVFAGVLVGFLLDSNPGIVGHQHVFWLLVIFAAIGGVCAYKYHKISQG